MVVLVAAVVESRCGWIWDAGKAIRIFWHWNVVDERKIGLTCNVFGSRTAGWMEMPFLRWRIWEGDSRYVLWAFRWIIGLLLICFCLEMTLWSWMFYSLFMLFSFQIGDSASKTVTRSLLEFNTTETCKQNRNHKIQSSITFLCGKTLVSPHRVTL